MAKILITGSSGFLGSEIIRQAVALGHEVTALKRATSNVGALKGLQIRWVVGDVTDATSLVDALKGQEYCIHTAGDISYLLKDRSRLERVNVEGARNIATAARAAGVKRLVHTSSVAAAHLGALEKGVSGKRYILGGTSLSHGELLAAFARAFEVPLTGKKAPDWLWAVAGGAMLACERIGIPTRTPSAMVRLARIKIYHCSDRAKSERGYRPRPLSELISRVVDHQRRSAVSN